MGLAILFAAAAAAAQPGAIAFREVLEPLPGALRLGDVIEITDVPPQLRARASVLVIARDGQPRAWSHRYLAARARSLMPALGPWLTGDYPGTLQIYKARGRKQPVLALTDKLPVAYGDKLTARATTGIFTIDREATALQPAESGTFVFMRTRDGVIKSLCCGERR